MAKDGSAGKVLRIAADAPSRDFGARWGGHPEFFERGFVALPTLFVHGFSSFKPYVLTPAEFTFLVVLLSHKWDTRDPWPSYKRIASIMGVSEAYTKKLGKNLEVKGFLRRQVRVGTSNQFDLKPLFKKLAAYRAEATKVVAKHRKGTAA